MTVKRLPLFHITSATVLIFSLSPVQADILERPPYRETYGLMTDDPGARNTAEARNVYENRRRVAAAA